MFIESNQIKLAFIMIWLVQSFMICLKKQVLLDKANVVKNPIYDGRQCGIASLVNKFLIKRLLAVLLEMKLC